MRTGLESIRSLTTVLRSRSSTARRSAPRSGFSARRAATNDDHTEKKAAALPPTLTVPMILFFLPGLFAAILTPAIVQINNWN